MFRDPQFIYDHNTLKTVRNTLKKEDREIIVAAAFWGKSAIERLGMEEWKAKRVRIICNATSGGCNPKIIEELRERFRRNLRTNPDLHAKVYWTPRKVVITSANASSSGLWSEESSGNIEAGLASDFEPLIRSVKSWLDKLYNEYTTAVVDDSVIKLAWDRWIPRLKRTSDVFIKSDRKVLNAMDLGVTVRYPRSGIYSGEWMAPDAKCETIRIFTGHNDRSSLGGPILDEESVGNRRRRIYFRDDPIEHEKPRPPSGFRRNGCRVTSA
jgi:hypothetical protein